MNINAQPGSDPGMTDDDLWHILQAHPPTVDTNPFGSDTLAVSQRWINWAKAEILSGTLSDVQYGDSDHMATYLARFLRLMDAVADWRGYEVRARWKTHGYERSFLGTCLLSALAACDLSPDLEDYCWIAAQEAGYLLMQDVDDWHRGMASGSGWRTYVKLTYAGKKRADKAKAMPPFICQDAREDQRHNDEPRSSAESITDTAVPAHCKILALFQCLDCILYWRPQRANGECAERVGPSCGAEKNVRCVPVSDTQIDDALHCIPDVAAQVRQPMDDLERAMNHLVIHPLHTESLTTARVWYNRLKAFSTDSGNDELREALDRVVRENALERFPAWQLSPEHADERLAAVSYDFEEVELRIKNIARADCSVLFTGETGVGKEHVAREIHDSSVRSEHQFLSVNCAGLSKERFDAELFGYRKGSFTGAERDMPGLALRAKGGTVFLDELGDLLPECQANLLRFLQDKEIRPLGAAPEIVDVRIMAATNKPDQLTPDMIHRFDTNLPLPPLRQRSGEIPKLAKLFLEEAKKKVAKQSLRMSKDELDKLADYHWPGNVRQLQKALFNAVLHHGSGRDLTAEEVLNAARSSERLA